MKLKLLQDCHGYLLTFWTGFFGFILIPIMSLSIELGHYFYVWAEIAKAADAAELPAAHTKDTHRSAQYHRLVGMRSKNVRL